MRLLRAAVSAIAEHGYAATTIADIVRRARVSRQAFYRLFDSKEACLLAAIAAGRSALLPKIAAATMAPGADDLASRVRGGVREYLRVSASEPEFTRAWTLELPQAGPEALEQRHAYFSMLAAAVREAHAAHHRHAGTVFAALPAETYLALVGGCHELFYRYVSDGRCSELPQLEEPMTAFLLSVLH